MLPAIALWTPEDGLLGALAPLGAALAAPPCLVIDLDPMGPAYPGERSLADLVEDEPTEDDLKAETGVAVIRNGGVAAADAAEVVSALLDRWPRAVLRLPPRPHPQEDLPVVPVRTLCPGWFGVSASAGVWQRTPHWRVPPSPGVVLPIPSTSTVRALLEGRRPMRSRWVEAWRSVWKARWGR